jgi:hypothetical protein
VRGSVTAASISATRLGAVKIGDDLIDSSVRARGLADPISKGAALVLKSFSVAGSVIRSQILAGYDALGLPVNADVQIGTVQIGQAWIASDLVAGAHAGADNQFGTDDDALIVTPPGNDVVARIASIRIRGFVTGETAIGPARFGFVAEEIAKLQIGTARIFLTLGPGNDNLTATDPLLRFGLNRDVSVREITP